MIQEFTGKVSQDEIYGETYTNITGRYGETGYRTEVDVHAMLKYYAGREVKITIETVDGIEDTEDMVTLTYKELFRRARKHFPVLGILEGGYDDDIWDVPQSNALLFMSKEEFAGRCHSEVGA